MTGTSLPPRVDGHARRRAANRQSISNAATALFMAHGFDRVSVDDIAVAAGVGRMTVFNHFPRKEDMFFDRDDEARADMLAGLRDDRVADPLESLRLTAHRMIENRRPYVEFSEASRCWFDTVRQSPTLTARACTIRDEIGTMLATALAGRVGRGVDDPEVGLVAALVVAAGFTAFLHAHRVYVQTGDPLRANAIFLDIVDRGIAGARATLSGGRFG